MNGEQIDYILINDSTSWGNYSNATFEYLNTNEKKVIKTSYETNPVSGSRVLIPTGSTEYTKINNIYDMAGNVREWTLETNYIDVRIYRGGYYSEFGNNFPARYRYYAPPMTINNNIGCRAILLIK